MGFKFGLNVFAESTNRAEREGGEEPGGRQGCWGQNVLIPGPRGGERPQDFQIPAEIGWCQQQRWVEEKLDGDHGSAERCLSVLDASSVDGEAVREATYTND